jgi:uncharacterized membrane protein
MQANFLLLVGSALLQLFWNHLARAARAELVLWQALVAGAMLSLPLACWDVGSFIAAPSTFAYLLGSGLLQAAYFLCLGVAYRRGDLSAVLPLSRGVGVAGTSLVGCLFLGEPIGAASMAATFAVLAGVVLLAGGEGAAHSRAGLLVGGVLALTWSLDRAASRALSPHLLMFAMFSVAALVLTPRARKLARQNEKRFLPVSAPAFWIAAGAYLSYLLVLLAFRAGAPGTFLTVRELALVLGSAEAFTTLKEPFSARKGIALAAIALGILLL